MDDNENIDENENDNGVESSNMIDLCARDPINTNEHVANQNENDKDYNDDDELVLEWSDERC